MVTNHPTICPCCRRELIGAPATWEEPSWMDQSRAITPLNVFRVLKANRKRSYRDIAHLIAEYFGRPA